MIMKTLLILLIITQTGCASMGKLLTGAGNGLANASKTNASSSTICSNIGGGMYSCSNGGRLHTCQTMGDQTTCY